jgi:hypothetical protein
MRMSAAIAPPATQNAIASAATTTIDLPEKITSSPHRTFGFATGGIHIGRDATDNLGAHEPTAAFQLQARHREQKTILCVNFTSSPQIADRVRRCSKHVAPKGSFASEVTVWFIDSSDAVRAA